LFCFLADQQKENNLSWSLKGKGKPFSSPTRYQWRTVDLVAPLGLLVYPKLCLVWEPLSLGFSVYRPVTQHLSNYVGFGIK
jgi:hypothetical protein